MNSVAGIVDCGTARTFRSVATSTFSTAGTPRALRRSPSRIHRLCEFLHLIATESTTVSDVSSAAKTASSSVASLEGQVKALTCDLQNWVDELEDVHLSGAMKSIACEMNTSTRDNKLDLILAASKVSELFGPLRALEKSHSKSYRNMYRAEQKYMAAKKKGPLHARTEEYESHLKREQMMHTRYEHEFHSEALQAFYDCTETTISQNIRAMERSVAMYTNIIDIIDQHLLEGFGSKFDLDAVSSNYSTIQHHVEALNIPDGPTQPLEPLRDFLGPIRSVEGPAVCPPSAGNELLVAPEPSESSDTEHRCFTVTPDLRYQYDDSGDAGPW